MTRQTSIEAYHTIKENGLLSERRWQVYDLVFRHGPLTGNQLIQLARKEYPMLNTGAFNIRLSELRKMGVVEEIRTVVCPVTGHNVIEWDVTDRLPLKLENPKRIKCRHCDGKGYLETTQTRLF